jgi:twinkle protein
MAVNQKRVAGILVRPDTPTFLEREVALERETFDLATASAASILEANRTKQRNFSTSPFDPEGRLLRFLPGGYTVWSGRPGNGKSTLLRQLICQLLKAPNEDEPQEGPGVFVCSMEEYPHEVLMHLAQAALGREDVSENGLQWCLDLWEKRLKLWNYRPVESDAQYQRILAAIRVLARDHLVRHAFIDSLMCLDVPSNDIEAQRQFTKALARTAQGAGVHIHLVAHPRKPQQADRELDLDDVAGAADLGRLADNVLFVKRATDEAGAIKNDCTPMTISVRKQRHGPAYIGDINGKFNRRFRQFVRDEWQSAPSPYLPAIALEDIDREAGR